MTNNIKMTLHLGSMLHFSWWWDVRKKGGGHVRWAIEAAPLILSHSHK